MKRILLLGGFGFIGTNILKYIDEYLLDQYSVVIFDYIPQHLYGEKFKCIEKVYVGNFSDNVLMKSVFESYSFDYVIHLINTTVPTTSDNIIFDIESNVISTISLLNIMKSSNVSNIIYLSSGGAIYGEEQERQIHKEDHNPHPISSYGIVKLTIEKYLFHFYKLHAINSLVLRLSNPYGPYHYSLKQGVVNVALRKAINQDFVEVWGDGEAKKDYIYVQDFCKILFMFMKLQISNGVFNVASGQVLSLNQILLKIKEWYPDLRWKNSHANKYDILHFELNISKLKNAIGDFQFTSFEEGLLNTIKWLEEQKVNKN